jgi:hypothetical protein
VSHSHLLTTLIHLTSSSVLLFVRRCHPHTERTSPSSFF